MDSYFCTRIDRYLDMVEVYTEDIYDCVFGEQAVASAREAYELMGRCIDMFQGDARQAAYQLYVSLRTLYGTLNTYPQMGRREESIQMITQAYEEARSNNESLRTFLD